MLIGRPAILVISCAIFCGLNVGPARVVSGGNPASKAGEPAGTGTDDQIKAVLRQMHREIKTVEDGERSPFEEATATPKVGALLAVGEAQFLTGDREEAQATWQDAIDAASVINDLAQRAESLAEIASAQQRAKDDMGALGTARLALQAVRLIKDQAGQYLRYRSRRSDDHQVAKAGLLAEIAAMQEKAGDKAASGLTFRLARDAANAIDDPRVALLALLKVAETEDHTGKGARWAEAMHLARRPEDNFAKSVGLEALIRAQVDLGAYEPALRSATEGIDGEVKRFALWRLADNLARRSRKGGDVPRAVTSRLAEEAGKIAPERPSRREPLLRMVAEAQALSGDPEGALKTLDLLPKTESPRPGNAHAARIAVLRDVAWRQLKDGERDRASATLKAALALAPAADWGRRIREDVADLQAEAGDPAGAIQTAEATTSAASRVAALNRVAARTALSGDAQQARSLFEKTVHACEDILADELWERFGDDGFGVADDYELNLSFTIERCRDARNYALCDIAKSQAKNRDIQGALATLNLVGTSEFRFGDRERRQVLDSIVTAQCEAGDFKAASKTADSLPPSDSIFQEEDRLIVQNVASRLAGSGDIPGAMEWALSQQSAGRKLSGLKGIAEAVARKQAPQAK